MAIKGSVKRSITLVFGLALISLALIGFIAYRNITSLAETNRWVEHTHEVIETLINVRAQVADVESGGRGFAITGDEQYLRPYYEAIGWVDAKLERLRRLTADNTAQRSRLDQLDALVRERIGMVEQLIELRHDQGSEAALKFVGISGGNLLTERIRVLVSEMEKEERRLLDERSAKAELSAEVTALTLLIGGILCVLLLAIVYFLLNREIAKRRTIEAELRETTTLQQAILNSANYTIISVALDGTIRTFNAAAETLLGYSAEEVVGRATPEIIHDPEEVARRARELSEELGTNIEPGFEVFVAKARPGAPDENEWTYIRKDGSRFPVLLSVTVLRDTEGHVTGFMGIGSDITERKRFEKELAEARDAALESARLKAEFLANMSHEIRTPMNAIIGMTGLLLDTNLSDEQRDYGQIIRTSADALLAIINDVLDFSKIEAGKLSFETMDFDLGNAVEGAVELLAEQAQAKGIELFSLVYSDVPTALRGDAGRLRQVIVNLLGNAIKFTHHGEVVIRVTKESETDTEAVLRFAITDTGIGIPEESQRFLFQAFSQADGSTTRKYGGTGLGLAISSQLVQKMNGEIGVESLQGKGSTFWFTARFEKQSGPARQPPRGYLEGVRVMIVDDNATNRKLVHHQIISWGMRNGSASSGQEALEILRREAAKGDPYTVVILDMQMPEMDGLMLAQAIKSDRRIADVRVVMLTSIGKPRGDDIRDAGVEVCLTKPVKQSQLFDCLANLMAASAETREPAPDSRADVNVKTPPEGRLDHIRILVAEDNVINQKVALRQLQKLGYGADAVADGQEALDALARIPYTIVLMDCQMPEVDGYEATRRIRERESGARHTIIIAMTANALEGDREECLAAGMDDYISKPVKETELARILERWITNGEPAADESTDSDEINLANVLDPDVIASLRALRPGDDSSFLGELFDLFINETPERLAAIRAASERGDAVTLARNAHALKGGSSSLGVRRMAELCEILEQQGRAGTIQGAGALISVLEEEFARARHALEAEKQR